MVVLEINRNDSIWSMGQRINLSYFVTGTYPNIKSGCHYYQIGMDYLYDTIFKMEASEVKLHFSHITPHLG